MFAEPKLRVPVLVGTTIGLPRAGMCADEIALEAEFFFTGTNDLTQTGLVLGRDDGASSLPRYVVAPAADRAPRRSAGGAREALFHRRHARHSLQRQDGSIKSPAGGTRLSV